MIVGADCPHIAESFETVMGKPLRYRAIPRVLYASGATVNFWGTRRTESG